MSETTNLQQAAPNLIRTFDGVELPAAGLWHIPSGWASIELSVPRGFGPALRSRIRLKQGMIAIADDPAHSTAHLSLDAASVRTGNATIDDYLHDEVLNTRKCSTIPVHVASVAYSGGSSWAADGWITVRGASTPIELAISYDGVFRRGPAALVRAQATLPLRSLLPATGGLRGRLLAARTLRIDVELHAERIRATADRALVAQRREGAELATV